MQSAGLVIENLHVGYGRNEVVHGVDITVPAGRRVALLGANGAGKTTILRTVSGLIRPKSGSVRFGERALAGLSPADIVAQGVVQVPEGRRVFPALSVEENLRVAHRGRNHDGVGDGLERVYSAFPGLAGRKQQAAGLLSGGQQQMVALGRAIMARPRLLLLDEMSLGLAPILVKEFYAGLAEIFPEGLTMLVVEQNARVALDMCQDVYVLRNGVISTSGPAQTFQDSPELLHQAYLGVS